MMKQTNDNSIHELISGFFAGNLNNDELNRLNIWLEENVSHVEEFNQLRSMWILSHSKTGREKFINRANRKDLNAKIHRKTQGKRLIKYLTPVRYVASLLICVALGGVIAMGLRTKPSENFISAAAYPLTTINAPLGSRSNIILPDGSTVCLNAGSTITYQADFGMEKRDLYLSGEAFFNVRSDSVKAFNVLVSGITVSALGTRFNVRAYQDDNSITATLEEGIVNVLIPSNRKNVTAQSVQLKPKEQLVVHKIQAKENIEIETSGKTAAHLSKESHEEVTIKDVIISSNIKTELSTSWKDTKWIIENEPLDIFVIDLERRYNLNIRFASEDLKQYKFSGVIEDETVEQILTALSIAAPVNYKSDKNDILLTLNKKVKNKFDKVLKQN